MNSYVTKFISLCFSILFTTTVYATETNIVDENNELINEQLTGQQLKIYDIIKDVPIYTPTTFLPITTTKEIDNYNSFIKNTQTVFEDGDVYYINRIHHKSNLDERYEVSIPIIGNEITIRYVDPITNKWVNTSNLQNLKHATLYIDTDFASYVFSVPAVYKNLFTNNTLTIEREKEELVTITKDIGYFNLTMSFPQDTSTIAEYWYIESNDQLVDWSTMKSFEALHPHDLSQNRRWSYDGYYFLTPSSYVPSGKDMLYRHPSNYTGASFTKYQMNPLSTKLGYIMTETCMKNINEFGYWETGPQSNWLFTDFNIGAEFYDTRFNTDFATNLLYAYQNYNNKEFLGYAVKYAEFFLDFATNNSYDTQSGGILVADYGSEDIHEKTHVSLNHHLAEMNFLYEVYSITKEPRYLNMADRMLIGIQDTRNQWVLPDANLKYALYYTKDTNPMIDYPYLTYNDLFITKTLLNKLFDKTDDTIEFLMASKKYYMDTNNITGYYK